MTNPPITSFHGEHAFLSNFHAFTIEYKGNAYPTIEHFFQAQKAVDPADHDRIKNAPTPRDAKRLGRTIDIRADWDAVRLAVMRTALDLKFTAGTPLADRLLATGESLLVEGNTWGDRYWGQVQGHGHNWLGHLLMARRSELRATNHDDTIEARITIRQAPDGIGPQLELWLKDGMSTDDMARILHNIADQFSRGEGRRIR